MSNFNKKEFALLYKKVGDKVFAELLEEEYKEKFANPYIAARRGYVDDIIEPKRTRPRIIKALEMLKNKRDSLPLKKHGNIPL